MTSASTRVKRSLAIIGGTAAFTLVLAGCAAGGGTDTTSKVSLLVGTTDKVTALDPAGSYDAGSNTLQVQVFPTLLDSLPGSSDPVPNIVSSASFTSPTDYTVVLKSGLKFANGDDLTSSDVKFSFDRQLAIADENGPSVLLYNLESTEAKDDTTVVFHLKAANDQIWPQILTSPAAPIVDEDVFSATAITPDADIVKANAFAGQYTITKYDFNNLVRFEAFSGYKGALGAPKTAKIDLKTYASDSNLKLDIQEGNIDVAYRTLAPTDIADLKKNKKVKVVVGPGGAIRYITFNFDTQPFGAKTKDADPKKALAVRQAVADLINRDEIASQVYKGTVLPLYSYVPAGLNGATDVLKGLYGDGNGGPSLDKAKQVLADAGVTDKVVLNLQYNSDHYGEASADEFALVKSQLEESGLFTVNLQSTEWVQYTKDWPADTYPVYQLGWSPDYSDADNYLSPFFTKGNFLANHYDNKAVQDLIAKQASETDAAERTSEIEQIQALVAADLSTVPLWQGAQLAVTGDTISGAILDGSFKFRFATLARG
jgi:peptide/nickel transport system substrate-binding protein